MLNVSGIRKAFRKSNGKAFFAVDYTGPLTLVTSSTGKMSAVLPKASVPISMKVTPENEAALRATIGTQSEGNIVRTETAPREFIGDDGKPYISRHQWVAVMPGQSVQAAAAIAADATEAPVAVETF